MARRINVILPEDTLRTIDRIVKPGGRSRFIHRAIQHYVKTASPEALREQLKQAALRDRDIDLEVAEDWFAVDQEQWQRLDQEETPAKSSRSAIRREVESTSRRSTRR